MLCALWDRPAEHRYSVPTVVKLVNGMGVRERLRELIVADWSERPLPDYDEPFLADAIRASETRSESRKLGSCCGDYAMHARVRSLSSRVPCSEDW